MKKINKSNELLWLFGIIFVALGVSICSKANLGVSMIAAPAFVISEALMPLWSALNVGVTEYIFQGVLLVLLCIIVRRFNWRYLLAFAVAVIYGYVLNLFLWIMGSVEFNTVAMRWVMLIVGDIITALGVACFFRTYMPLQVYELFVAELVERFNLNISKTKWIFDLTLLVISIVLAVTLFGDFKTFDWSTIGYSSFHSIGLGTLVTTAINSPIISLMGKLVDRIFDPTPRFAKLEQLLKRN
ncbi:MAG: hypothetical protein IJ017_09000 [Oscillospiraceae bacterium]|nr:hypothetical protein [Oscillospiraceae bacterium]